MIVDCVSDPHGAYPELEGGDLLIVAGDLTARDHKDEYAEFELWLAKLNYAKKILIGGNHDNKIHKKEWNLAVDSTTDYLCDSGIEFDGLKIWGSPWSLWFQGINPHCKAFTGSESDLKKKYDRIPDDIDILITHTPPKGILDNVERYKSFGKTSENVGCKSLQDKVLSMPKLKLHVFGHIHAWGGQSIVIDSTTFVNASIMNDVYDPVNKPVRVIL